MTLTTLRTGMSLFWRVFLVQLVYSFVVALLLTNTRINHDIGMMRYKPTIAQASFALVLWLSTLVSNNGLVYLPWGNRLELATASWRKFTNLFACLALLLSIVNLASIYLLSVEQWLTFKTVFPLPAELLFCLATARMLSPTRSIVV